MKIQCNACEAGEANVLCCADEAALCWACDDKIHAANKLASKHQRVPLSSWSSQMPKCDICQETVGYFFCLEDRALLCRKCDVGIHTANSYVAGHQRFLLTGVKVGLEAAESGGSNVKEKSNVVEKVAETTSSVSMPTKGPLIGESNDLPFAGITIPTGIPDWHLDEFLGLSDVNQSYGVADTGSSKVYDSYCM